ncbi:MAG TPA: AAA family ATPase, partial [Microbacterium sp.]|nr:AAA family ATPase [Microbacterium sp.]
QAWDVARRWVDDGAPTGSVILTGSAHPAGAAIHSGAGRIVPLRMRPLSLAERFPGTATVSLGGLLSSQASVEGISSVGFPEYVREITASGFP